MEHDSVRISFDMEDDDQGVARWFYGGTPPPDAEQLGYPFTGAQANRDAGDTASAI